MNAKKLIGIVLKKRYLIQSLLGEGRFAQTFVAKDQQTDTLCAIKILNLPNASAPDNIAIFKREIKVLTRLAYPGIPRYRGFFTVNTPNQRYYCLVRDYVKGKTLTQLRQEGHPFSYAEIRHIGLKLYKILLYLHALEPPVLHRNIKPNNIIVDTEGQVHLIDFSAIRDEVLQQTQQVRVGTHGYMPYEQFSGQAQPSSDIYALGAVLVYLYSGKEPTDILDDNLRFDVRHHLRLPNKALKVLEKILAFEPEQRYSSASQLQKALVSLPTHKSFFNVLHAQPSKSVVIAQWVFVLGLALGAYLWVNHLWSKVDLEALNQSSGMPARVPAESESIVDLNALLSPQPPPPPSSSMSPTVPAAEILATPLQSNNQTDRSLLLAAQALREQSNAANQTQLFRLLHHYRELETHLHVHTDNINAVAVSPNQKLLAVTSDDNTVSLWDIAAWDLHQQKPLAVFTGHQAAVLTVAFSNDNHLLASGSADNTIRLWDTETLQAFGAPLTGYVAPVHSVAFSYDNLLLAGAAQDGTVQLWQVTTQLPLSVAINHPVAVKPLLFSNNDKMLIGGDAHGQIHFWTVAEQTSYGEPIQAHDGAVLSIALAFDKNELASAGSDGLVKLWNLNNHQALGSPLQKHQAAVQALTYSQYNHNLISADADGTMVMWHLMFFRSGKRKEPEQTLLPKTVPVNGLAFSSKYERLISVGQHTAISVWNHDETEWRFRTSAIVLDNNISADSVAFSPDSRLIAVNGGDSIEIWNVHSLRQVESLKGEHNENIYTVAFSPDGQQLASGAEYDKQVVVWSLAYDHLPPIVMQPKEHSVFSALLNPYDGVLSAVFSPNGKLLATGAGASFFNLAHKDNSVRLWDVEKQQLVGKPMTKHTDSVWSVAFSPDGKTLASTGQDGMIYLWDVATQKLLKGWAEHSFSWQEWRRGLAHSQGYTYKAVKSVAFSPDGQLLATVGRSRRLKLWNAATGALQREVMLGYSDDVMRLAFSPDGTRLAMAGGRTIELWDVAKLERIGILAQGEQRLTAVAFSPNGQWLVGAGKGLLLWQLDPAFWIKAACRRANRDLTLTEWQHYVGNQPYQPLCSQ